MIFTALCAVVQCGIIVALGMSAAQEAMDAQPGGISHNGFIAGGVAFETAGAEGYCCDEGLHRPPGYFMALENLDNQHLPKRAALVIRSMLRGSRTLRTEAPVDAAERYICARNCAARERCIGFAMDLDICAIYLEEATETPEGWTPLRSDDRSLAKEHKKWAIVMTDNSVRATCFMKVKYREEPEKYIACLIYMAHILGILWIGTWSAYRTFKNYFVPIWGVNYQPEE